VEKKDYFEMMELQIQSTPLSSLERGAAAPHSDLLREERQISSPNF
jgi:hypothetical protein